MHSAIYKGWVRHRRFEPKDNAFKYNVFMMYIDLDEIDSVLSLSIFWSKHLLSFARFKRDDFLGSSEQPLGDAVRDLIKTETGMEHSGPIRMLANLRYFGFCMNPIVCYYCFDENESLRFIVAEVTNTPWKERKAYVLRCDPERNVQRISFNKQMHVSPFNPMDMNYQWRSSLPANNLSLHIDTKQRDDVVLDATLCLKRERISSSSLAKVILLYPLMTMKVFTMIYWQAIKLLFKGVPYFSNPSRRGKSKKMNRSEKGKVRAL